MKEATGGSLPELSRAAADRTLWPSLIHRVTGSQSGLKSKQHARKIQHLLSTRADPLVARP